EPAAGLEFQRQYVGVRTDRAGLHFPRRTDFGDLQRGLAVFPDRVRIPTAGIAGAARRRGLVGPTGWTGARSHVPGLCTGGVERVVALHGIDERQSDGRRVVWPGDGLGL